MESACYGLNHNLSSNAFLSDNSMLRKARTIVLSPPSASSHSPSSRRPFAFIGPQALSLETINSVYIIYLYNIIVIRCLIVSLRLSFSFFFYFSRRLFFLFSFFSFFIFLFFFGSRVTLRVSHSAECKLIFEKSRKTIERLENICDEKKNKKMRTQSRDERMGEAVLRDDAFEFERLMRPRGGLAEEWRSCEERVSSGRGGGGGGGWRNDRRPACKRIGRYSGYSTAGGTAMLSMHSIALVRGILKAFYKTVYA